MGAYCAWCAIQLPTAKQNPVKYVKHGPNGTQTIEVALCEKDREKAKREGWVEVN